MGDKYIPSKCGSSLMNFGEYHDWAYGEIHRDRPQYEAYICMESKDSSDERRQFREWATLKVYGNQADGRTNNNRLEGRTCLPSGENSRTRYFRKVKKQIGSAQTIGE